MRREPGGSAGPRNGLWFVSRAGTSLVGRDLSRNPKTVKQRRSTKGVARRTSREGVTGEGVTVSRDVSVLRRHLTSLRDVVRVLPEPRAGILPKDGPAQERVPALNTRPVSFPRFKTRVTLQRSGNGPLAACVCVLPERKRFQQCHLHPSGSRPSCCVR